MPLRMSHAFLVLALLMAGCAGLPEQIMGGCPPLYGYEGAQVRLAYNDTSIPPENLTEFFADSNLTVLKRGGDPLVSYYLGEGYHGLWEYQWRSGPENLTGEARGYAREMSGPLHRVNVSLAWRERAGAAGSSTDEAEYVSMSAERFARDLERLRPYAYELSGALHPILGSPDAVAEERVTSIAVC